MSRRLLASYVTLTIVVLAALEIPLGIQYGRNEKRDLTNRIVRDALVMATFAEDPLENGASKAPCRAPQSGADLPADPGRPRRCREPAWNLDRRHARPDRPEHAHAGPARDRHGAGGERCLGNAALESARHRPDLRRGADRLGRPCARRRPDHLSDVSARLARDPVLAPACGDRRRRARRRNPDWHSFRSNADEAPFGPRAHGGRGGGRRPDRPRARDGTARDPGARHEVQRDGGTARRTARLATSLRRRRLAPAPNAARGAPSPAREPRAGCGAARQA